MMRVAAMIATGLLMTSVNASGRYVAVPDTTWTQLFPYLEANLRVEYVEGSITVGTSSALYERKTVEPYDDTLGEFATVFLSEAISERRFQQEVERITQLLKDDGANPETMSPDELAAAYWKGLASSERLTKRLQKLLQSALAAGRLKCMICDNGFEPQHLSLQ